MDYQTRITNRPLTWTIEEDQKLIKSPFVNSLLAAAKGALVGGTVGAGANAIRGGSAGKGLAAGALLGGLLAGAAKYYEQEVSNINREAELKYHAENLKRREPFFFMPPPAMMGEVFSKMHEDAHRG